MSDEITLNTANDTALARYGLEPQSSFASGFQTFLSAIRTAATTTAGVASSTTLLPEFQQAIEEQKFWSLQMQLVSMESNVEKSKHECSMAAIRNVSVR